MVSTSQEPNLLARRIGLPLLTFYGLGTILGAGIYVLVGKVAASSGLLAPLAFILAALVATLTALSYCQLVVQFPKSAGEAYYLEQSFHRSWLTILVGYLVVFTGIVSAATLANGFVGYLASYINIDHSLGIVLVVAVMGLVALWGIAESLWLAAAATVVEVAGLVMVVYFGADNLQELPRMWDQLFVPMTGAEWVTVLSGAFIAFYAFVGFEDMVNIVEEVKQPKMNMPRAILLALVVSGGLYLMVAVVAVLGLPLTELSQSTAPLKDLLMQDHPQIGNFIGVISLFAIINGVLIQTIMASRVLYGMAGQQRAPGYFLQVSSLTKTPWLATLVVIFAILVFALWLPLETLAKTTSFIVLTVFTLVNSALWKLTSKQQIDSEQRVAAWPKLGAVFCLCLLLFQIWVIA